MTVNLFEGIKVGYNGNPRDLLGFKFDVAKIQIWLVDKIKI